MVDNFCLYNKLSISKSPDNFWWWLGQPNGRQWLCRSPYHQRQSPLTTPTWGGLKKERPHFCQVGPKMGAPDNRVPRWRSCGKRRPMTKKKHWYTINQKVLTYFLWLNITQSFSNGWHISGAYMSLDEAKVVYRNRDVWRKILDYIRFLKF